MTRYMFPLYLNYTIFTISFLYIDLFSIIKYTECLQIYCSLRLARDLSIFIDYFSIIQQ